MAELRYDITANVTGAEDVESLKDDLDEIGGQVDELDGPTPIGVTVPEGLSSDIDDVGTSLDDMGSKSDDANTKGSVLESTMGKVAAGALIVGEAIDIAGQFVEAGTRLWEAYRAKQELTEEVTRGVTEAILDQSGALAIVAGELEDVIANAENADEILNASIWEGIEATQGAEEIGKLRTALLDVGLTFEDLGATIVAFEDGGGAAIGDVFAGNTANLEAFNEAMANLPPRLLQINPALADLTFEDFATTVGTAVQSADDLGGAMLFLEQAGLGDIAAQFQDQVAALEALDDAQENVDYGTLIDQTFEAAQASEELRGVLDSVRTDLGPDASEFEVWLEYTNRLQEVQTAAQETDAALDDATAPREAGEVTVDLEAARTAAAELQVELDTATAARTAPITAEADTVDAEDELDALPLSERIAEIEAEADTIQAASDLLDTADEPRSALIVAHARTAGAEIDLAAVADKDRTAYIDVATGSVSLPSAAQLAGRIGTIYVPIVGVYQNRTEGSRPR